MKVIHLIGILLVAAPVASAESARHVLIVANNADPEGSLQALRFADDDGARYAELFSAAGARVELLTTLDAESQKVFPDWVGRSRPPTLERLRAALAGMFQDIRQDRAEGRTTELFFIFTGHGKVDGGTGRLLLADGALDREQLFAEVVASSPADHNHVIIDACHAYFLVMARGEWKDDRGSAAATDAIRAYLDSPDALSRHPTTGVILSTAGTAEVHEWERYRSGIFSHELRSGLLGPADADGDGRVTYGELEAFLAAANAGVTNPKARVQVFVQPPLQNLEHPVVELRGGAFTHFLRFPREAAGRFEVEDARGMAYADWNKAPDHASYLALLYPPVRTEPRYFIRRGDRETSVRLAPPGKGSEDIAFREETLAAARSASRGSVAESFRKELFSVPFGSAFVMGFDASRDGERVAESQRAAGGKHLYHALDAAYVLSDGLEDEVRLAHGVRITYRWSPWDNAHLTIRFGWRHSDGEPKKDERALIDDLGLRLGGGFHWDLPGGLHVSIEATVGNHWIFRRYLKEVGTDKEKEETSGDNFAPSVGLSAGLRITLVDPLFIQAQGGVSLIFASPDKQEREILVPEGTFAIGFQF